MAWQNQADIIKKKITQLKTKNLKSPLRSKKNHVFSFEVYMQPNHKIMIAYAEQLIPII